MKESPAVIAAGFEMTVDRPDVVHATPQTLLAARA
jgi:hypothetical protein